MVKKGDAWIRTHSIINLGFLGHTPYHYTTGKAGAGIGFVFIGHLYNDES